MRILLTGSNGFVGKRIAADAVARGWEVVGLGRAPSPAGPVSAYVRHDLSDPIPPGAVPGRIDAVVHCAALASPWAPPSAFVAANVHGTRHVVAWANAQAKAQANAPGRRPHLAYVSSSSVLYRDAHQEGLTEDSPVPPDHEQLNAYSRTKRIGERAVEAYEGPWTVLRPRAIFGPGDTVLLPRILRAAQRGVLPVLEPAGGPPIRTDLTYVDTAAHYVLEAVARGARGTYNVTNAEPVDLYPFLVDLLARLGARPRLRRLPVGAATALAGAAEWVSAAFLGYAEPPITRFGVSVLAHTKTFDVARCVRDLGAPPVSLAEGVERLVAAHG